MSTKLVSGRASNKIQNYLNLNFMLLSSDVGEILCSNSWKPIVKLLELFKIGC